MTTKTDLASVDFQVLYEMANAGSAEALAALRKLYEEEPKLFHSQRNLAQAALGARLKRMVTSAQGTALVIRKHLDRLEKELAGENPTPLERILVERIVMCWLDVQDHELRYSLIDDKGQPRQAEWRSRMLDKAHRRFLAAVKSLADVRRLNLPPLQLNIAEQQINSIGAGDLGVPQ